MNPPGPGVPLPGATGPTWSPLAGRPSHYGPPSQHAQRGRRFLIALLLIGLLLLLAGGAGFAYVSQSGKGDFSKVPSACSLLSEDDPDLEQLIADAANTQSTAEAPLGGGSMCTWQQRDSATPSIDLTLTGYAKDKFTGAEEVAHRELRAIYRDTPETGSFERGQRSLTPGYGDEAVLVEVAQMKTAGRTYFRYELHIRRSNLIIEVNYHASYPNSGDQPQFMKYQANFKKATLKAGNLIMAKMPTKN